MGGVGLKKLGFSNYKSSCSIQLLMLKIGPIYKAIVSREDFFLKKFKYLKKPRLGTLLVLSIGIEKTTLSGHEDHAFAALLEGW